MWNINAPQGRIPCEIFTQFAEFVPRFSCALAVEILLDLLKGLWSYGGFKLTVSGYPQILANPSGKTMRQTPKVLEVQEHARGLYNHAKFGGARISPAVGVAKNVEFFVCLFVCWSRF